MSTILITGASGFIGSALARAFAAKGWRVVGAGRTRPPALPEGVEWRAYDLAWKSLPPELLDGVDAVVHGAVVRGDIDRNVAGSVLLLEAAQGHGIKQTVFLSSLAAHNEARSQYGKQKFVIERLFEGQNALVIRPGLVLGEGGVFRAMCNYLRHHRLVPLINGGCQPLQTVFISDLVNAIEAAVARRTRGTFTIAETEPVTYRAFYEALAARLRVPVTFVSIPFWLVDLALRLAALFHIALPIDRDNLLGLSTMQADHRPRLPGDPVAPFATNIESAIPEEGWAMRPRQR